ncbi:MAG: tRNA (adenosine(37)-N6)-threonylcarbamoyltransferase complex transferase subunit TsaD, partial [Lutimonas sp.]
ASGNPDRFIFPHPKTQNELDFSFSGLKTSILYFLQKNQKENQNFISENKEDICASIQKTIIDILMTKLKIASQLTGIKHIAIAGGVSANSGIRQVLKAAEADLGWTTYIPKFEFTTDNAAMIGIVGYFKYLDQNFSDQQIKAKARLSVEKD